MSDSNIKISIIIPVLNGEATLEKCLLAVASQAGDGYEIIVVDNGSTDRTPDIIKSLAQRFSNINYILETRRGRGWARNAGLMAAHGEIIAMTDVDCLVPSDWLRRLTEPIISHQSLAVSGFERDATGNYWSKMRQADDWRFIQLKIKDGYIDHLDTKNFAIRADLLKRLKFNSELIACEDLDLFIRLKLEGIKIYFLPDLLVAHYHDASIRELVHTQLVQGYSAAAIISHYQHDSLFTKIFSQDKSFNFSKLRNFLLFIPWAIWQFIYHPVSAPYRVLADLSWKIGVLKFKLKNIFR